MSVDVIETLRLRLRPLKHDDLDALSAITSDPSVMTFVGDGAPLFCTRVEVDDSGEIVVSGPTVSPTAGGVLRTGDLGRVAPDGRITVLGRADDVIISGGENVAPQTVEAALEAHPAVAEAGARGRADERFGEVVVASVVLREGGAATESELLTHCRAVLAPWEVPKAIAFTAALPRTASG